MNNQSEIELEFKIGHCNGTMNMQIFVDDMPTADYQGFKTDSLVVKQAVNWPAIMKIVVSNKNLSCDTKVDNNGTILEDKFIELTKIIVDRVDASTNYIKSIVLDTGEDKINSNYWGFNGTVNLCFDQSDSFTWHLQQRVEHDETYITQQNKF
jgi:hypothetical protein